MSNQKPQHTDQMQSTFAFDVTPRRYVTGIISERGICEASERAILDLYPEFADAGQR